MPDAATTQASSCSQTTGNPVPVAYGYRWVTGLRRAYFEVQDTGSSHTDYHRVGFWLLGHGEWDGCSELYINDVLVWRANVATTPPSESLFSGQNWVECLDYPSQPMVFNFHSGCDSTIGSGLTPQSSGPDQNCDVLWAQMPPAINPVNFNRIAYYALMRKQPLINQTNTHQNDPTQWTDIAPIGLWRAMKCRIFDGDGNQMGYAFTTNPAWHIVDIILRRKLMPDYNLSTTAGPDTLPAAVSAYFDWESIYESAQYFDGFLTNGRRRFAGNYSFAQQTSLQAILTIMLRNCRSYLQQPSGQIQLNCDAPRASVFIFSRDHILPGTWEADDKNLNNAANRYVGSYRELLVPAASTIASITSYEGVGNPIVTTEAPHPFNQNDWIAIGGTGTVYDGVWQVATVPPVLNVGTPEEVDPITFTMVRKGANYPTAVGAGGACGLLYSRFAKRTPVFDHQNDQLAQGTVGLGIARFPNRVPTTLEFDTCTYDQCSRISRYERDRSLGVDQSPYVTPPAVKFRTSMFAKDVNGNLVAAVRPGDHVTIDDTASFTYAGEFEVLEPMAVTPPGTQPSASGASLQVSTAPNSGEIEFSLGPYNEAVMYDTSDDAAAGWPTVPGSDPGNDTAFTSVALANGGNFVFFTGQLPSGSQFQLPSTGYPTGNMLAWAGPAGANVSGLSMCYIQLCGVDSSRNLSLIYADADDSQWGGDVNYAALTWLSPDVTVAQNGITWLELTLQGGETIVFGQGILEDGTTVQLPAGFAWTDGSGHVTAFAVAFPHDSASTGFNAQSVGAYVDAGGVVHFDYDDSDGHVWPEPRNANVLVFAAKNNMGTVAFSNVSGANWMTIALTNGNVFGVGCAKSLASGATFGVPSAAQDGSTLEPIVGSSNGRIIWGNHAQGVGSAYLDQSDVVHVTFNDGSGDTEPGSGDVFATFCVASSTPGVVVVVSPNNPSMGQASTIQFVAQVLGNANQSVSWSVDGVAGGSTAVGTIDVNGNYTAPVSAGTHTITATSAADTGVSGSAMVTVTGAQSGIVFGISGGGAAVDLGYGTQTIQLTVASGWRLTGGSVTLVAASEPLTGTYTVTVNWDGITAVSPSGLVLNYTDGSDALASNQSGLLAIDDPTNVGGALVALYISGTSSPPTGSQTIFNISTLPALGATAGPYGL